MVPTNNIDAIVKKESGQLIDNSPHMPLDIFNMEESGHSNEWKKIEPAFVQNNIPVCIVSSEEYAPFAAVVVQSVISNINKIDNYDIVVLTDDMLLNNRWRIEKLADGHENVSVRVMGISHIIEKFTFYTWAHFTPNTYYRLLIPDLFDLYNKVIYLDSDVAVNHDIAELYNMDMGDYFIAAAYDTHVVAYCTQKPPLEQRDYNIKTLKLKNPEAYFQTGVSMFNIKAFRENYEPGYLIEQAASRELRWLDQDLINLLFQGKIMRLPNVWNVMIANLAEFIDEYYLPEELRKEYYAARRNPYIVHYVGRAMPCYTTTPDLYEYYWKYARLTPFYEILLQRMVVDYSNKLLSERINFNIAKQLASQEIQADVLRILIKQMYGSFKSRIKNKLRNILLPVGDRIFPKGTKRRSALVRILRRK